MSWTERKGTGGVLVMGDEAGQTQFIEGVLVERQPIVKFPGNFLYMIETTDGERPAVAGTAGINARLSDADIGKLIQLEFRGWGQAKNGKFKDIAVRVQSARAEPATHAGTSPAAAQDGGDGLPF